LGLSAIEKVPVAEGKERKEKEKRRKGARGKIGDFSIAFCHVSFTSPYYLEEKGNPKKKEGGERKGER